MWDRLLLSFIISDPTLCFIPEDYFFWTTFISPIFGSNYFIIDLIFDLINFSLWNTWKNMYLSIYTHTVMKVSNIWDERVGKYFNFVTISWHLSFLLCQQIQTIYSNQWNDIFYSIIVKYNLDKIYLYLCLELLLMIRIISYDFIIRS